MSESAQAEQSAPEESVADDNGSMFEGVETHPPEQEQADNVVDTPENPDARPEWLPEKFKSPEDLVKAYNEMGRKIREKSEPPEQYELQMPEGLEGDVTMTDDDIAAFRDAGLTNDQAQKLVHYFSESVIPALVEERTSIERDRLANTWGVDASSQDFAQKMTNLKSWASRNLPEEVVQELGRSASGVQTIERMMAANAAGNQAPQQTQVRKGKAELQALMDDPRYAARDDDYMRYVQEEFHRAYD